MRLKALTLSFLAVSGLFSMGDFLSNWATAKCVQADVSVQYNISGSKEPTNRSNDVDMESDPSCRGNASVTTGVQGNVGGNGPVEQHRTVRHRQRGSDGNSGGNGGAVQIRSNPGIDVYNPAENWRD
ncbi:MAG: hypothetical protein IGR93_01030 [Hydrococcus sp. C42_A2020_068]|uniref:hypothetical protein n=1 Tax=Pleurocapsa sp. PCC 7327 TaxID=118163 RepID=UPI00029FDCF8|nr:hypothetical protein [Pleurocapsa sp. PCC 7327]AFY76483.1 hypothetical protein Ple7327_1069 [Pleurocapsa sp. PCC 7327]MBF2018717.1 hypothetical protein [Hydrococcus sp. C42_A2020_068]